MQNSVKIGDQKLLFGNFAIRLFCRLQGCTGDQESILMEFGGPRRGDALFNIIRAGIQSACAEAGKGFDLNDFQISEFVDKAEEFDNGDSVLYAFLGSVINKPADEVPAWIEEFLKSNEKQTIEAEVVTKQSPNVEAVPITSKSGTGTTSKAAPTDTV